MDRPVIICPTVASTDAPCSALSVVYTDEGVFQEYLFLKRNPDVVLVDTAVIAASPLRLTVAGMGDALATYFEVRAHAIHNGMTVLEECHHMNHGEKVAFGTLTQLVLESADQAEVDRIMSWCVSLGLPVTLGQLGVAEVTREKAMQVAQAACAPNDTIGNLPCLVTPELVCDAILKVDAMGREYLKRQT